MRKTLIAAVAGLAVITCLTATAASTATYTTTDVTSAGASGNGVNTGGAFFFYNDPQPTGTGFIDPFLREQNTGSEFGVNTSIKAQDVNSAPLNTILYDNKDPVNYTHDLLISSLKLITVNNVNYYEFFLDANQVANGPISLTTLKVFVAGTAATTLSGLSSILAGNPVFDMNAGLNGHGQPFHQVNIASDNGSGSGDMRVLIPAAGITGNNYLYLEAGFGEAGSTYGSNDGFEEWNALVGAPVPDSASALGLLGIAMTAIEIFRRKFRV